MKAPYLNALRALEATLRRGGFRAAADDLGVTPAAVGQHIRSLENYVQKPLFDRTAKGAEPSALTSDVSKRLTAAFQELDDIVRALADRGPKSGVAITMTQDVAERWLPRELPDYLLSASDVDLRIGTGPSIIDLRFGEFDFAIRHLGEPDQIYEWVDLFPSWAAPVCTPDFARHHGIDANCKTLADVPVGHDEVDTTDPDWLDWSRWCDLAGIEAPSGGNGQRISGGISALELARSGVAIVLSGLLDSYPDLESGRLVMPFGTHRVFKSTYSHKLIWLKGRRLSPHQVQFRRWITKRAERQRLSIASRLSDSEWDGAVRSSWPT